MTQSVLTKMPNCSSMALILVYILVSPPSYIITRVLPPASTYCLTSWSSLPVKGILGPPSRSRLESCIFLRLSSSLLISHYRGLDKRKGEKYFIAIFQFLDDLFVALVWIQHFFLARIEHDL